MGIKYNQFRAMLAISKASFRAIFRSPSAVVFSFGFPLIFILVFGFIGGGGTSVTMALLNQGDTNNYVIRGLLRSSIVRLAHESDSAMIRKDLEKGRIAALITIDSTRSAAGFSQYTIHTL